MTHKDRLGAGDQQPLDLRFAGNVMPDFELLQFALFGVDLDRQCGVLCDEPAALRLGEDRLHRAEDLAGQPAGHLRQ